jgi:hypothetical protein
MFLKDSTLSGLIKTVISFIRLGDGSRAMASTMKFMGLVLPQSRAGVTPIQLAGVWNID